eukprot:TRINITY_DN95282_c0_g1_i1.p1 TRINITY_DN95282_c0_g1~~TRINITY_DN95282_c0_g1_i1.p1  ORF type:complete len:536 (+),score=110.55 TRINITY_DN95282_c0_g1_i1:97-1608(+)
MPAPEQRQRILTETAAITAASSRSSRSYLQRRDSENMNLNANASLSTIGERNSARLGQPAHRRSRVGATAGLATSRTVQRLPCPANTGGTGGGRQFGSLSDITNLQASQGDLKKGTSAAPRPGQEQVQLAPNVSLVPPALGGPVLSSAVVPSAATAPEQPCPSAAVGLVSEEPLIVVPYASNWATVMVAKCREKHICSASDVLVLDRLGSKYILAFRNGSPELTTRPESSVFPLKFFQKEKVIKTIQQASEYVPEIMAQLFYEETAFMPRPNYMEAQGDINGKMRSILIDWLIEVHMKYRLRYDTLFLAVNLIDRHLSVLQITRKKLQLVGVSGMFIAAKYEEIDPPRVNDFVYITDNTYTRNEIMDMECTMLTALGFEIVMPTQAHFLEYMVKANGCSDPRHEETVKYLLELALVDTHMLKYKPSHLVAAAILLSNELFELSAWSSGMELICRHTEQELRGCADEMRRLLRAAPSGILQAVRKKYMRPQNHSVASMQVLLNA